VLVAVPTQLDPDAGQARRWLKEELSQREYADQHNVLTDMLRWLADVVGRFLGHTADGMGGAASWIGVAVALALVAAFVALVVRLRRGPRPRSRSDAVLGGVDLSAAELRAIAARAYAESRFGEAAVSWFRALAVESADRTLLAHAATLTAHEIALRLAEVFPDQAISLRAAADRFDRVLYGRVPATRADAEMIRELDATVSGLRPATMPVPAGARA
jgi:hypothetical protein